MKIERLVVTPIAFRDPPLLNSWGVHEPLALRTVLELHVEGGIVGIGEGSGDRHVVELLRAAAEKIRGVDVYATNALEALVRALPVDPELTAKRRRDIATSTFSIIEVACLDAQGKHSGVSVSELLGGRVRDSVPYSAYLFYKWAGHPGEGPDVWGEATDPAGIVQQAHTLVGRYGFTSLKLKAGVFAPELEIATIDALAAAFPGLPLRIDPNGAWTPDVAVKVADRLAGKLEYLEDPVFGIPAMAEVSRRIATPLATNMCVVSFDTIAPAVANDAVQIVLADHHAWGGLQHSKELAAICGSFNLGVSMHSNSHLGISLAAMTHLAAATPNLAFDSDTHYPWNADDDIIPPGSLTFRGGAVAVPEGPGLGVDIDPDRLAAAHELYRSSRRSTRDDTGYMRTIVPDFDPTLPRFAFV
jgi:glucarate dehydratase